MRKAIATGTLLVFASSAFSSAGAADLKVLITNGMKPVMAEVASQFERSTGHKLSIRYEGSAVLQEEITLGENFDVAMLIASNMEVVTKLDKIAAATVSTLHALALVWSCVQGSPNPTSALSTRSNAQCWKQNQLRM